MIRIDNPTPATRQFLGDVGSLADSAIDLGGRRTQGALRQIADDVTARRIDRLSTADPAGIELTDAQWAKVAKQCRILASSFDDEW